MVLEPTPVKRLLTEQLAVSEPGLSLFAVCSGRPFEDFHPSYLQSLFLRARRGESSLQHASGLMLECVP